MRTFLDDLLELPVVVTEAPAEAVFSRIHSLSHKHRLTAYGAAYLDLAQDRDLPLATLDKDLIRASREAGVQLL